MQIPSGITAIASSAFSGDSDITSVSIPATITSIGSNAFRDCTNLQSVTFAENSQLEEIGIQAFWDCDNLSSITIPASVRKVVALQPRSNCLRNREVFLQV